MHRQPLHLAALAAAAVPGLSPAAVEPSPDDSADFATAVVERFFAWINRNRRLWKDAEATIASATAFLYAAAAMVLIRRIARAS